MVWCKFCSENTPPVRMENSFICCSTCGKVVDFDNFSEEPTFVKNAAGQSQLSGTFVRTVMSTISVSRERTLNRARTDMDFMVTTLGISGGDSLVNQGLAFFTIAIERNFTRGRRSEQVEASCLYIACRDKKKPFLLIDFSDYLKVNVYVLGAVFLQLCKLLSLEEHPIIQKPVDPSLFIHRFTSSFPGGTNMSVSRTALRIVSSMKRDWMQTGRKPSGVCGAALYISALSHGIKISKVGIIKIVHICEGTLTKRLLEFENTESGGLTLEEFNSRAEELERVTQTCPDQSSEGELLCEHKGSGRVPFAHGLCHDCYEEFITISGGVEGGSNPPAFEKAERVRETMKPPPPLPLVLPLPLAEVDEGDSECLTDIDDEEVDCYLHNEEEKRLKKIIWEELNKEYMQEQAEKEAAAVAAKEALQASFSGTPEEFAAAQELATAAAAIVAKSRKEKQKKKKDEAKNEGPARTATEATMKMLTKKRLSSKINYDVLERLFDDEPVGPDDAKKPRVSSPSAEVKDDEGGKATGFGGEEQEEGGEYGEYDGDGYEESNYHDYSTMDDGYSIF